MDFSDTDREALAAAMRRLEAPRFAGRMTTLVGRPAELVARALPAAASGLVAKAAETALTRALDIALFSLRGRRFAGGRVVHSALASASGAIGGRLRACRADDRIAGLDRDHAAGDCGNRPRGRRRPQPTPPPGSPVSKSLRLGHTGATLAEAAEGGYFAVRALLARGLALAADTGINKGSAHGGSALAHRVLALGLWRRSSTGLARSSPRSSRPKAVVVVGAVGGAAINLAFIEHFQELANGHFTVRRLERVYGAQRCAPNTTGSRMPSSRTARCR